MKRLVLTHIGGMPFEQEDLKYMQDATKEELVLFIKAFRPVGATVLVLSGGIATASGSDVDVSAALLLIDDELVSYGGGTVAVGGGFATPFWEVDSDYDTAGNEVYEDGNTHDTYEFTYAQIAHVAGALSQDDYMAYFNNLPRLQSTFHDRVIEGWHYPTLLVGGSPWIPFATEPLRARMDYGRKVSIEGSVLLAAGGDTVHICTLPAHLAPVERKYIPIKTTGYSVGVSDQFTETLRIDPDGKVWVKGDISNSTFHFMDGISYALD